MTAALTPSSIMACVKSVALTLRLSMESLALIERMLRVAAMMPIKRNGRKDSQVLEGQVETKSHQQPHANYDSNDREKNNE